MSQTGFESRIKVQDIIESQLPEFILDESPKTTEFLKQYYISQEFQSGTVDIVENLDQYLKLDNLIPEVIVGSTGLTTNISSSSGIVTVTSTKGFPQKYGLLKIDDEIITYTGITTNTFTGCIRGFSAITDYHEDLNDEELVFSTSKASSHVGLTTVQNLSVLFLQEFYKKLKYSLTPGFENLSFTPSLNVGNFIKEARTFYETKGTSESFRILFNVLFGEEPKVVDLEQFLIKPSSALYTRRISIVADVISGDPLKLVGQTIVKSTDSRTTASVSEIETITRKGKTYYKLLLFLGYDDAFPTITGDFQITASSKNLNAVNVGDSVISVDSTIGFPPSGKLYVGTNVITYTSKSINQFFGCSGIVSSIPIASIIRSADTYYGYEDGDTTKKVEFRLTGTLSGLKLRSHESNISVGEKITIKNVGEVIKNTQTNPTRKEVFANSWIYNTSSRYQIKSFTSDTQFILSSDIDKSSLKVDDFIDILLKDTQSIEASNLRITSIDSAKNEITVNSSFTPNQSYNYEVRRRIKFASLSSSTYSLEFNPTFAEIQNVYNENDENIYVASNSLPSYQISKPIFSYNASGVSGQNEITLLYSIITFSEKVSFITGSEIYYKPSQIPIPGLSEGIYYVEVVQDLPQDQQNKQIKLYLSKNLIGTDNYSTFGTLPIGEGTHNFVLNSQKEKILSPQKLLRKFPLSTNIGDGKSDLTEPGSVGMLINGVEILSYKSNDKIYYGPLEDIQVLDGGKEYDVLNPPRIEVSDGSALIQPVISGSIEKIYTNVQDFDIDVVVSVAITGGNGKGASFQPIIEKRRREIEFDARDVSFGGGLDFTNETITFTSKHGLIDGEPIIYRSGNVSELGIGTFKGNNFDTGKTLIDEAEYYVKYINDQTVQLYESLSDYIIGINTVGFTTIGNSGIQKFLTRPKNTLKEIKVINGGEYQNRKLRVSPTGISTINDTVTFINHGFNNQELITYDYQTTPISGLSTTKQYYVIKIDNNSFRLSDAGIGGTSINDYERGKYVKFETTGSGYQIFSYPQISFNIEYSSVGIGSTQFRGTIEASPVIRGKIIDAYVYENGSDYGSNILNFHKKPNLIIKNGKYAQLIPIIESGKIKDVSVQYGGVEFYSTPEIKVTGSGTGAVLKPIIVNNKISDVVVINPGAGYSTANTLITAEPSGKNAILSPQVRPLTVNVGALYNDVDNSETTTSEIVQKSYENLQYYICQYSGFLQSQFKRYEEQLGFVDTGSKHSPIIGWAYDGNPIYGSYGYSNPSDNNSNIKKLTSGYTLNISNVSNRPSEFEEGFFIEDYQFTNSGDLDEYNGRFCVTPEFPNGVYAYFATTKTGINNNQVGSFPYFIGDRYRSKLIIENKTLSQSFDFNNSSLIRNTFPYKVSDKNANNDFIEESNEITNQITTIESVTVGSIDGYNIINSGSNYKVGDSIQFDETQSGGSGAIAQVSEIEGKNIVNLQTTATSYDNAIFIWERDGKIKIKVEPKHTLENLDYVNISGFSTDLSKLNGTYQIGVTSYTSSLISDISTYATTGIVTDIYVSNIPKNISIGSSIKIDNEIFSVLNIFNYNNIIRVSRQTTGAAHTSTSTVYFVPDSFIIENDQNYFDSKPNDLVYFNPKQSIGLGTIPGAGISTTYTLGNQSKIISIPTQSIYLPNHPFKTNQAVTFVKPGAGSSISVSNTSTSAVFNIPSSGNEQTVYIIKKSVDHIGIVTQIGLTTTTNGLFFRSNGSDDYRYLIQSSYEKQLGNIQKITAQVTCDSNHDLTNGDQINLLVQPNLSVGIGTSVSIKVKYNSTKNRVLINQKDFSSSGINTTSNLITINNHGFETGDKVFYTATSVASGLTTGFYYTFKVSDDSVKLCETLKDSVSVPPQIVDIKSTTSTNNQLSLVNPKITAIKNNNLVFDLSDSSLSGYKFKVFYDKDFKDEFVSTGATSGFTVTTTGIIGSSNAKLTINCNNDINFPLFYALEKSGYISTADKDVQNYSEINFIDSFYNGSYTVSGIGSTTFNLSLKELPEKTQYSKANCDILKYTTKSLSSSGGISQIRTISSGSGYENPPTITSIASTLGSGAYIIPFSNKSGNINQFKILNEGFEYSSDKTLQPEASISKLITIQNANVIKGIEILDGGKNYITKPDLIVVDSQTGNKINSGALDASLENSSIGNISIIDNPKGLPESTVRIVAINNTNGVGILSAQASSSGIITCTILTPLFGFSNEPFAIGDKIYVEGLQKSGTIGDGLNSEDYGYQFFTVSNYLNGGSIDPRKVVFDISGLTTNPGIASSIQGYGANIINYKDYPKFEVTQETSQFISGEPLEVKTSLGFVKEDLKVSEKYNKTSLKLAGSYDLEKNQVIKGIQSGSLATVNEIKQSFGRFSVGFGATQVIGWYDNIGKLSEDSQVLSNNDYYQNLSYTIKSKKTWNEIVSPVNNLAHVSGLKNFADTEILKTTQVGAAKSNDFTSSIYFISDEKRVDTINNYDLTLDVDVSQGISRFLKFKNKKIADYIECITNRVLEIDDISDRFLNERTKTDNFVNIVGIDSNRTFEKYIVQVTSEDLSEIQFSELIVLTSDGDTYTLDKSTFTNKDYLIADIYADTDEFGDYNLVFSPADPYDTTYNIKYLNVAFDNLSSVGVGTTSFGFVDLIGITTSVSVGSTVTLIEKNLSTIDSIHSTVHIIDNTTDEMNYVEFFVTHDGTDTYISDLYFDTSGEYSSTFIGTFTTLISGSVLKINYKNTSTNPITIRTKNVGFGSTSIGIGTYRFKLNDQQNGQERTVKYESSFANISSASTIFSFDTSLFSSVKSIVKIGLGETSSLHQVMTISNSADIYVLPYPFLSIGSTSGIGTFGGEINGSIASLSFYPDPEFSGTFEILSFNEIFYTDNDTVNTPPALKYGNVIESVGVSKYFGINDEDYKALNFQLNYENVPIFMKKFNPSNSNILNLSSNEFTITNHFFNTGEELIYRPKSSFAGVSAEAIGIGSTLSSVGIITNLLPSTVYAIRIDNDRFKVATRKEFATSGIAVTFTSVGVGNVHEFEMVKKNEKSIICIDNIIQSPLSYSVLNYTLNNGNQISATDEIFGLSGITSIKLNDILKIDNEYMKVVNVGLGTTYSGPISFAGTFPLVEVKRAFVGSTAGIHTDLSTVNLYRGSYNIVGSDVYFTEAPTGIGTDKILQESNLPYPKSYFNGRVFLKKDYTTNKVYDDISDKFTGIGQTYILTVGGINSVGLGISIGSGILLINGIFQTPSTQNNASGNFSIIEDSVSGITSIVFSGNSSSSISNFDVNNNELPRGGLIVSLGSTPGLGYAPLVSAAVTAVIGAGGSIVSIGIGSTGNWGSGYNNSVSIAVTESGHSGTAATITAVVGAGGTLSFVVIGGGTGYVNPTIDISPPSYSNLSVTGVSRLGIGTTTETGSGLLLNVDVGSVSTTGIGSTLFQVIGFDIVRSGYGFKKGDVIKPVGLVTAYGLSSPINEFKLTVLETFNDSFCAWQFGEMDYIDSIKSYQNGSRKRFQLYYNSQLISFEKNNSKPESSLIDFNSLLLIFVNGILQQPKVAYSFDGGTSVLFSEAPKPEDNVAIFFYRGSSDDSSYVDVYENIKDGDTLQVFSNNNLLGITTTQEKRTVLGITSSSQLETTLYSSQGIDDINDKPVYWTKQKVDKIINGEIVSKARDSIEPQIYPTAKIIQNLTSSQTELFVDNAQFFNYENDSPVDFDAFIISGDNDPVSAAITAVVSAAGTIQSLSINNVGSGYTGASVDVKLSAPKSIGVGIGTTATASISVVNGSLSTATITNPGFGYTQSNPPQVITPLPKPSYENISNIDGIDGSSGKITAIGSTVGIGTSLAIKFTLDPSALSGLATGYPVYIFNTFVGGGVTSIIDIDSNIVGVGTTFLDNIYYISGITTSVGIITCNVHSQTNLSGIQTSGSIVGRFSWGKLSGFSRSSSPITISVSGHKVDSGLSTFPTIQRREYGLRNLGALKKIL